MVASKLLRCYKLSFSKFFKIFKFFKVFQYHSDQSVTFAEEYKDFLLTFISDCSTSQHIYERIKFKLLKSQNVTSRQKAFALIYIWYIKFQKKTFYLKNTQMPLFLMILSIVFVMFTKLFIIRTSLEKFMDTYTVFVTRR